MAERDTPATWGIPGIQRPPPRLWGPGPARLCEPGEGKTQHGGQSSSSSNRTELYGAEQAPLSRVILGPHSKGTGVNPQYWGISVSLLSSAVGASPSPSGGRAVPGFHIQAYLPTRSCSNQGSVIPLREDHSHVSFLPAWTPDSSRGRPWGTPPDCPQAPCGR